MGANKKQKTEADESVPVLSCLLGDLNGAIQAELWRNTATDYLPKLVQCSQESNVPVLLELNRFSLKPVTGKTLQSMKKISFTANSELVRINNPSAAGVVGNQMCFPDGLVL